MAEWDGPRLIRRDDLVASHRLRALCFPGFVEEVGDEDLLASTRLVLGAPEEMRPNMPVGPGALGEIIPALFPLPSFLPGLNFR
jgi:hypothetical protein